MSSPSPDMQRQRDALRCMLRLHDEVGMQATLKTLAGCFRGEASDPSIDWSKVSPLIFGALYQSARERPERRQSGEHYTSERDIERLLGPLFLDELRARERAARTPEQLEALREHLASMHILDPAAGCGNFLAVAFRELRRLEGKIVARLPDAKRESRVSAAQFHAFELDPDAAHIAKTVLTLIDEREGLGSTGARPHIVVGNALELDWDEALPRRVDYIVGNPPFGGHAYRSAEQSAELKRVFGERYRKLLDYSSAWFLLAARYANGRATRIALLSTNSITQGEQVEFLWGPILEVGFHLDFAYEPFAWRSDAQGSAVVHVVIVGYSQGPREAPARLFTAGGDIVEVDTLSPYLVPGPELVVRKHRRPLSSQLPATSYGSLPADGGGLVVQEDDYPHHDPVAQRYLRPYIGAKELLSGRARWCIWAPEGLAPGDGEASPFLAQRLARVASFRERSRNPETKSLAKLPHRFFHIANPDTAFVAFPGQVSGSRRWYTPLRLCAPTIPSNSLYWAADPDGLAFALTSSSMFAHWLDTVGGKLKSDPRFGSAVYNAFPLPWLSSDALAALGQAGLALERTRQRFEGRSLAQLYASGSVPSELEAAHQAIDALTDAAFAFAGDDERRATHLLEAYEARSRATKDQRGAKISPRGPGNP